MAAISTTFRNTRLAIVAAAGALARSAYGTAVPVTVAPSREYADATALETIDTTDEARAAVGA